MGEIFINVVPAGRRWMIKARDQHGSPQQFDTQVEAITRALEIAMERDLELQIHSSHGRSGPERFTGI